MKLLTLTLTLVLTGCATPPQFLANHFDKGDICQTREFAPDGTRLKPAGYQQPYGCGGSRTVRAVVRDNNGRQLGVITNR